MAKKKLTIREIEKIAESFGLTIGGYKRNKKIKKKTLVSELRNLLIHKCGLSGKELRRTGLL